MKTIARLALVLLFAASAAPMAALQPLGWRFSPAERALAKANYDPAYSDGRAAKVGKMVFTTAVAPHWLEFSGIAFGHNWLKRPPA